MKIAIQGHPTRGKEIIQILESLGGINSYNHLGSNPACYYEIHGNAILCACTKSDHYKYYTLEEFEKEFPFKVGDIVLLKGVNKPYEVIALEWYMNKLCYKLDSGLHYAPETLTTYKEMKKERNITLTLDKAKEWYKKGGELKEIALQAFTEKELNPLPRSWEKFCRVNPVKTSEAVICTESTIVTCDYSEIRDSDCDREICPSKESAEAHLAMIQLEQLRDCWRQGWIPSKGDAGFGIRFDLYDGFKIIKLYATSTFLSFPTIEMAEEFLECFRDLIEKAGDLI